MHLRNPLALVVLAALVVASGCVGTLGDARVSDEISSTTSTETTATTTTVETTETARETTRKTTQRSMPYPVGSDPAKGSDLLSVSKRNESEASRFNESERAGFDNLSDRQQEAFEMALRCDCNVVQSAFVFCDDDRVTVVKYDGEYYYLRVAVV